jgi:DNA-binding Lrp family transcriptional regulator
MKIRKEENGTAEILDEIDKIIIHTLRQDCFTPFVKIASKLRVTEGTIRHRVKKLMKSGIIKRFTVDTDPTLLGFGTLTFVIISVSPGLVREAAKEIAKIPFVLEVHEVHTYGDLLLKIRSTDLSDTAKILSEQVKKVRGVVSSQVIPVLNVWKDETMLLVPFS